MCLWQISYGRKKDQRTDTVTLTGMCLSVSVLREAALLQCQRPRQAQLICPAKLAWPAGTHTPGLTGGFFLLPLLPQHQNYFPPSLASRPCPSAWPWVCWRCDFWSALSSVCLDSPWASLSRSTEPLLQNKVIQCILTGIGRGILMPGCLRLPSTPTTSDQHEVGLILLVPIGSDSELPKRVVLSMKNTLKSFE